MHWLSVLRERGTCDEQETSGNEMVRVVEMDCPIWYWAQPQLYGYVCERKCMTVLMKVRRDVRDCVTN